MTFLFLIFYREGIRLRVIGDSSRLLVSLQKTAREAEEATRNNSQLDLTLAISYSGRRDIVQACRSLEAEQLPAVAVGVLGALLHGHAVARLRGGRLPGGPGLLPEQGEAVRCQEIVAQSRHEEGVLERSLAGKRWSVEHDGFGPLGLMVFAWCGCVC